MHLWNTLMPHTGAPPPWTPDANSASSKED
jgi:hypothetical protein